MNTNTIIYDPLKPWRFRPGKSSLLPLLIVALSLVWPHRTPSQTATTPAAQQPLPQRVVYGQIFKHIVFLDQQAAIADQRGQNGALLRDYYQTKASLTAAETALLKSTAHGALTSVQAVDQQIQAAVARYRAQFAGAKFSKDAPLPPIPQELKTLQTTKDNLILDAVASLQMAFGSARFQNLDTFVQTDIAPHITLTAVKPPPPPSSGTLPPLAPVGWN